MHKMLTLAALLIFVFDTTAKPAHAYLDPGAGSYAIQIAIAGIAGGLYAFRGVWNRVLSLFRRH